MELQPGQVVADRYTIESVLGAGGVAVVYLVRHHQLGTLHALKRMANQTPMVRQRLLQEGRAQGALRHHNLVAVTDVVDLDGWPALVLDYVNGPPLDRLLARQPLDLHQADALARGILEGVAYAHANHFVHRDLKPANVLCAVRDGGLVPKVADFGLVKCLHPDQADVVGFTRTGASLGTPAYMAPEQITSARDIDARADVWALGVLLYELVTGVRPFQGANPFAVQQAAIAGDRLPVRDRAPHLPDRFVAAIDAALSPDPADRPADAAALRALWVADTPLPEVDWSTLDLDAWTREPAPPRTGSGSETLDAFASDPSGLASTHAFHDSSLEPEPVVSTPAEAPPARRTRRHQATSPLPVVLGGVSVAACLLFLLVVMLPTTSPEAPAEVALTQPPPAPPSGTPFSSHGVHLVVPDGWDFGTPKFQDKAEFDVLRLTIARPDNSVIFLQDFRPRSRFPLEPFAKTWTDALFKGKEKAGTPVTDTRTVPFEPEPFLGTDVVRGLRVHAAIQPYEEPEPFTVEFAMADLPDRELFVVALYDDVHEAEVQAAVQAIRSSLRVDPLLPEAPE